MGQIQDNVSLLGKAFTIWVQNERVLDSLVQGLISMVMFKSHIRWDMASKYGYKWGKFSPYQSVL